MVSQTIEAVKRTESGKNEARRLRASGMIPAVMYSHGESETVAINAKAFGQAFKGHISESVIINLAISGGEEQQVFVKDYQLNPVDDTVIHLDLFKITAGEKIQTTVQVEYTGSPIGVKKGGAFEPIERELEVEVLPKDLPEKLVVDISNLDIHESVKVGDINAPESMTFTFDTEHILAHVVTIKVAEETEEEEAVESAETVDEGSEG